MTWSGIDCTRTWPYGVVPVTLTLCACAAAVLLLRQGVAGWVHEGLLAAAAYVVSNTVDALAEAAQRYPGWPLVVAGEPACSPACLPACLPARLPACLRVTGAPCTCTLCSGICTLYAFMCV
jgi:hypothetical protein